MKTTFTLIILMVFGFISSAEAAASKLHLDLFNDGNFVVVVDGVRYTNVRGQFDMYNLRPGTHSIRITETFNNNHGRGHGHGHGHGGQSGREVLYNGSINIPFNSAVFAYLTNDYNLRISQIQRLDPPRRQPDVRTNPRPSTRYPQRNEPQRRGGRGENLFETTKSQMTDATFDDRKLIVAKQFASGGSATSSEIAELMTMMSFDKSKLELAKYSYNLVIDPQNYLLVNRSFTFSSSVKELDQFIGSSARKTKR
ncbi:MAG: DUF4476 domain-containing protein [Flavobacteriales bacterium]|nr:DUF4476 domain-containing protein [Flavobacteriales bacterium]